MPSPNPFIDDQAASEDERESNPPDAAGGDEEDEDGATPSKRKHRSLKKRSKRGKRRRREGARHEEEFDPRQDPEDTIPVPGGIDSDVRTPWGGAIPCGVHRVQMDVMSEEDEPDDDGARPVDEKKKMRKRGGGFEITPEEAMVSTHLDATQRNDAHRGARATSSGRWSRRRRPMNAAYSLAVWR
eukprot:Polyplicarium_translucidae@DN3104_c0_g1_i1.p2